MCHYGPRRDIEIPSRWSYTSSTEKLAGTMYEDSHQHAGYKALILYYICQSSIQIVSRFSNIQRKIGSLHMKFGLKTVLFGVNKLDKMMNEISNAAELSRVYTNHSVRVTAITLWSDAGIRPSDT